VPVYKGCFCSVLIIYRKGVNMLEMAKEKKVFQFLFSTEDLNFDPNTVEVIDTVTGRRLKVESTVKTVRKRKEKIFGVRMAESEIQKIRQTARRADMEIGEFAREALAKAVAEKEGRRYKTRSEKLNDKK